MRRSSKTEILRNEAGEVVGVYMKADFTAEHEWGISDLNDILGVNRDKLGINGRIITSTANMSLVHGAKGDYLSIDGWIDVTRDEKTLAARLDNNEELHTYSKRDEPIDSAWSKTTCCVVAKSDESKTALKEIYEAAKKNNLAIWIGGGDNGPFGRGGLVLAIKSRLPKDVFDNFLTFDKDKRALKKEDSKFKMQEKIRANNGTRWHSVSPEWAKKVGKDGEITNRTKHKIVYWVNGFDISGWYTVEELNEWVDKNTGVIPDAIKEKQMKKQESRK